MVLPFDRLYLYVAETCYFACKVTNKTVHSVHSEPKKGL